MESLSASSGVGNVNGVMGEVAPSEQMENGVLMGESIGQTYLGSDVVKETRSLVSELCRHLYSLGWVLGTGGSITIKVHDDSIPKSSQLIVMSPFGMQKEKIVPEDMYVLSSDGIFLSTPPLKLYPYGPLKCTDCDPLFLKVYEMCNAGAVIHSHGIESCLVTMIHPSSKEFRIAHMEMIKRIRGHGYYDELVVPIIENTAHEEELLVSLAEAIRAYPKTTAVLVRNHGVYTWGDSWISAKTQAECYHYLFDAAIKLHQLGLDWSSPSHSFVRNANGACGCLGTISKGLKAGSLGIDYMIEPSQRCILVSMERMTTPMSYLSDVLFPYASSNLVKHLAASYDSKETQRDIGLLCSQIQSDLEQGIADAVPVAPDYMGKDMIIDCLAANVEAMARADRKVRALEQLQGHIWKTGFQNNELSAAVFDDVPGALERWHAVDIKVYTYSCGSREAQQLLFANSNYGDLRKFLCGFFDTTLGSKNDADSYIEILRTVGANLPEDMLFVTGSFQEAEAARAAGLEVMISVRQGNEPLPANHGFRTTDSLLEI